MMFKIGDEIKLKSLDYDMCYGEDSRLSLFYIYKVILIDSDDTVISGNGLDSWIVDTRNVRRVGSQLLFDFMYE